MFLVLALLLAPGRPQAGYEERTRRPDPSLAIPALAEIAGVKVGYNTMAQLERRFGSGLVMTGGHPQGARLWRLKRTSSILWADGFEYRWSRADRSAVIDGLTIGQDGTCFDRATLPAAHRPSRITWHGLSLGMTRAEVLRRTKGRFPSPRARANALLWEAKGFVRVNDQTTFRSWTAELDFERGRLSTIDLECE